MRRHTLAALVAVTLFSSSALADRVPEPQPMSTGDTGGSRFRAADFDAPAGAGLAAKRGV